MYFIQNYLENDSSDKFDLDTVGRIVRGQYMGSSEFEFGSVQRSWEFLRNAPIKLFAYTRTVSYKNELKKINFYVISDNNGFSDFVDSIVDHIDNKHQGQLTKESTCIYKSVVAQEDAKEYETRDAWLDVSNNVSYRAPRGAIFFTHKPVLATRIFMELKRKKRFEHRIFDEVFCADSQIPYKVCALNKDDSISVKRKYGKAHKVSAYDAWPKHHLIDSGINELILYRPLKFVNQ